jgi:hypothetical protein
MSYAPICPICKEHVNLEESRSDEYGRAIHENCYVWTIELKKPPRGITRMESRPPSLSPTFRA